MEPLPPGVSAPPHPRVPGPASPPGPPPGDAGAPPAAPAPPVEAPPVRKSALLFFLVLLGLFGPGMLAQAFSQLGGLAWSEVFVFFVPALIAAAGSNLRPVPFLGLGRPRLATVALGAAVGGAGFLIASAVMAVWLRVLPRGWIERFDVNRIFDAPLREQIALAIVASLLAPLCEETAFRGYLQRAVALRRGPAVAIATSAALFGILHLDPVRFPALIVLGAVFGWLAWRGGTTWPAIVAHAVNNGIGSLIMLSQHPTSTEEELSLRDALTTLGYAAAALALLLVAYRRVTPAPPPAAAGAIRIDPTDPSTQFRPARVPLALRAAVWLGIALLIALLAFAAVRARHLAG